MVFISDLHWSTIRRGIHHKNKNPATIALRESLTVFAGGTGGVIAVILELVDPPDAALPCPALALSALGSSALRLAVGV